MTIMRLIDLLQLTNDLNDQINIFLTIHQQIKPLAKLKISSSACLLYPGQKPMTKAKMTKLVKNLHGRNIPLYIIDQQEKINVYGIQIVPENNLIKLT